MSRGSAAGLLALPHCSKRHLSAFRSASYFSGAAPRSVVDTDQRATNSREDGIEGCMGWMDGCMGCMGWMDGMDGCMRWLVEHLPGSTPVKSHGPNYIDVASQRIELQRTSELELANGWMHGCMGWDGMGWDEVKWLNRFRLTCMHALRRATPRPQPQPQPYLPHNSLTFTKVHPPQATTEPMRHTQLAPRVRFCLLAAAAAAAAVAVCFFRFLLLPLVLSSSFAFSLSLRLLSRSFTAATALST